MGLLPVAAIVALFVVLQESRLFRPREALRAVLFMERRRRLLSARPEWRPDDPRLRREGRAGPLRWVVQPNVLQRGSEAVPGVLCKIEIPDCAARAARISGDIAAIPCSRVDGLALPADALDRLQNFLRDGGRLEGDILYREIDTAPTAEAIDAARRDLAPLLDLARILHQPPDLLPERLIARLYDPAPRHSQDNLDRLCALIKGWPDRLRAEPWERITGLLTDPAEDVRLEAARFLGERDTLRALFWNSDRPDVMGAALTELDGDMFTGVALDLLSDPRRSLVGGARLFRARLAVEQLRARRAAPADPALEELVPLLLPALQVCVLRVGPDPAAHPADHASSLHYLIAALIAALADSPPPDPDPQIEAEIVALLQRPSVVPVVEIAAVRALAALGTARSLPALQALQTRLIRDARSVAAREAIAQIRARLSGKAGGLAIADAGGLAIADVGGLAVVPKEPRP